jgi:hypothetical protein
MCAVICFCTVADLDFCFGAAYPDSFAWCDLGGSTGRGRERRGHMVLRLGLRLSSGLLIVILAETLALAASAARSSFLVFLLVIIAASVIRHQVRELVQEFFACGDVQCVKDIAAAWPGHAECVDESLGAEIESKVGDC